MRPKRRQLTVMFCDLGSTAMSAWLGPRTSGPSFHKPIARLDV
jgi:hypothetical protein